MRGVAILVLLAGCFTPEPAHEAPSSATTATATVQEGGAASPVEDPTATPRGLPSHTRRMSIEMLERSMASLLGVDQDGAAVRWTLDDGLTVRDGFETLGATLGEPDYLYITEEAREPTLMYVKLITDMAMDVCRKAVDTDDEPGRAPQDRFLMRFVDPAGPEDDAAITDNLRYLKLLLHGERVPAGDAEAVADLRTLYEAGAADRPDARARYGWFTVCVGMLSSPRFHLY